MTRGPTLRLREAPKSDLGFGVLDLARSKQGQSVFQRHGDQGRLPLEHRPIFDGRHEGRGIDLDVEIEVTFANDAGTGKRRASKGLQRIEGYFGAGFLVELANGARPQPFFAALVRLHQPGGYFPQASERFALGNRPRLAAAKRDRRAERRSKQHLADAGFIAEMRRDHDRIERLSLDDVVKKWIAHRSVGKMRPKLETADRQVRPRWRVLGPILVDRKFDVREGWKGA